MLVLSYINYYYNLCCQLLYRTVSGEGCYRFKTVLPGLRNTTPSIFLNFFFFHKNILNQQISRKLLTELYFEIHFYSAIIKFSFLFSINRTHKTFLRIKSQRRRHQNLSERNLEYDIPEKNEYLDMGIFMAFFIVVSLVCLIMIIKVCNWINKFFLLDYPEV